MKRALRIFIRLITSPIVAVMQIFFLLIGLSFVFVEWLFENADKIYSSSDHFKDAMKDFKNYWKGFLK